MAKTGIIIVSHSEQLAAGVAELVAEMANDQVVIQAAGGTGDGRIGTNTLRILEAIESMEACKSILVYCDMGSSIISTETAMDMIDDDDLAEKVHIVDCPLVEGCFAGTVQASITDDAEEIKAVSAQARELHKA
ncbi:MULTISPECIES: dihydroxyacetone kinase phosphoryl donor subunit DhaM [Eubacterium]|uniref:phosphoenolpyruvate--glycerone phosphotransferase n=1 Tax=Eubacterium barkeri TaxID=1528 RepID=A0A1H3EZ17_EUBBA|nr:dihydroxyacetone kinase phosphoryl donor subunit DhaM [Eubacterium barkeri]SDX83991.1 dihydroxyacetone kinase, phosphotransfer subunit [Eubacterium barkeri]